MTVQELGPTAADIHMLRTELDELLRARQYAAQRERRLAEAVRAASEPDRAHAYAQPQRHPDPELLRRLSQAQTLREGLGARCLELSERLLALEDLARQDGGGTSSGSGYRQSYGSAGTAPRDSVPPQQNAANRAGDARVRNAREFGPVGIQPVGSASPAAPTQPTIPTAAPTPTASTPTAPTPAAPGGSAAPTTPPKPPKRKRPTGARFGGAFLDEPEPAPAVAPQPRVADARAGATPPARPAPVRGARFGGLQGSAESAAENAPPAPADSTDHPEHVQDHPAGRAEAEATAAAVPPLRSTEEIAAVAGRIGELHRRGAAHESAAVVAQAAVTLAPENVAQLAGLLRSHGPYGSAAYLARATAHGSADQAAGTLAELRRTGLGDEASELFHALWGAPVSALPSLLAALERAGQSADGQTLLWEWASAPPAELAALAVGLSAAGRTGDVRHLLRQAAGRPIGDVVAVVQQLAAPSAGTPAPQLSAVLVREAAGMRSPADLAQLGHALLPQREFYQVLLGTVAVLEESRSRGALSALRSAGLPTEPPTTRARGRR